MSTAILISGQLRTFAKCWPTQRWHVLRHFADPHFFVCVQQRPENQASLAGLIADYGRDRVHVLELTDPNLTADLTPALSAAYHLAPYANAAPAHQLLLQHWYQQEVWKTFENARTRDFNTIIRLRGDLWFHSFENPQRILTRYSAECWTPPWGEFGGINDRFAIMGAAAAKYYFTVYEAIPELLAAGCPFHPESLVAANLERGNVNLHRNLETFFSTERLDGSRRWPEITPMDMLHASIRSAA